ncbi:MAG TPA: toll/interleukin-1 receptor domain-containing protein [Chloroflexota bacterium]|nr:toll/interleukin-1 receptor domain-containing protein [Chloroflexota bacterium]
MKWDVFISHASEDKDSLVAPLAARLSDLGVKVWYDQFALKIGDSLCRAIDAGLAQSRFGIVIISKSFISKPWPEYELRGLTSREIGHDKVILPIWHGVSRDDVVAFSPSLADKLALDTSTQDQEQIAQGILEVVRPDIFENLHQLAVWKRIRESSERRITPTASLVPGPIRHDTLPPSLLIRIKNIQHLLAEVDRITLSESIDLFRRDLHPEEEVETWEVIAAAYRDAIADKPYTKQQKSEVFSFFLMASTGTLDADKLNGMVEHLTDDDLSRLVMILRGVVPEITNQ